MANVPMKPSAARPAISALIIMGVSGVGKTTIAQRIAKALHWTFRDGDAFHPAANVAKMSAGQPLDDADRMPWLDAIAAWIDASHAAQTPVVVTCSALKRRYRDRLLAGRPTVRLVYLHGDRALIADRIGRRKGHFMPPGLLDSQFAALEVPQPDERAIAVDVALSPQRCVDIVLNAVGLEAVSPRQKP